MSLAPSFCLSLSRMQNEDRFAGKLKLIKFRFLLGRPQPSPLTLISVPVQRHKMNWSRCSAAAVDRPTRRLTGTNAISAEEGVLFLDDNPRCSSSPPSSSTRVSHVCPCALLLHCSLEQKMGHKKMFNGPEGNQRRSDKQNFGFLANGAANRQAATNGNSSTAISVCNTLLLMVFYVYVSRET